MASNTQFWFAWCGPGEGFGGGHLREDELIFSFKLQHDEGQFAELELEVANPYVGLLNPGRALWAWFSCSIDGNVYPLFYGRLIALPDDLFAEIIKIKLLAKPPGYAALQGALAQGLKVLPYFDPIFVDDKKQGDPDAVLEGYSALWHVDRFASGVSISDIIYGEDGTVYFGPESVFYDKVSMKLAGAPLLMCEIEAEVEWTQCDHTGVFELKTVPALEGDTKIAPGITAQSGITPTGGGGVRIKDDNTQDQKPKDPTQTTYSWDYKNIDQGEHEDGDLMEESGSVTDPFYGGEMTNQSKSMQYADAESGQGEEYSIKESYKYTYEDEQQQQNQPSPGGGGGGGGGDTTPDTPKTPAQLDPKSNVAQVAVEVSQDRKEAIYVAMIADVQPVMASLIEDEKDLRESLTLNSQDLVSAGAATISDGVYFSTARGQQSIEYLCMVARAHLLHGSRVIKVEWECPLVMVVGLSCRMNAVISDPRLPGASVFGKIVSYSMSGDGDRGEFIGAVSINSSVGNGSFAIEGLSARAMAAPSLSAFEPAAGTPVWVDPGYVEPGYQYYSGQQYLGTTGDFAYEVPPFTMTGLQLPVTEDQILVRHEYFDGSILATETVVPVVQTGAAALRNFTPAPVGQPITGPPADVLQYLAMNQALDQAIDQARVENPSWVEMEFRPVQGISTSVGYESAVSPLTIPKQIDLSAS